MLTQKVPRKPLALLKALIALGGQQVSEGHLIDALWPDAEGDKGQEVFEKTITRLRKLLQVDGVLQHREGKVWQGFVGCSAMLGRRVGV